MTFFEFFTDALLRGPMIGSMFMCLSASLLGVVIFLRKSSLLGETLSHATYPGVTFSIIVASFFSNKESLAFFIIGGAFISAIMGFWMLQFLQKKLKISVDSSLCLVLAAFFGVGVTAASYVQFAHTYAFRQIQTYLYGQAATMTDIHIFLYGSFSFLVIAFLLLCFKEIQAVSFDRQFAACGGIAVKRIEALLLIFIVLAIVIGIRSVGVVLMSAMLIAPGVTARQFSNRLSVVFLLAAVVGLVSGFLGNYLSVIISKYLNSQYPDWHASLPTGPMIVLVASSFAIFSLLFAPHRGLLSRFIRVAIFRFKRREENLLKALWRKSSQGEEEVEIKELMMLHGLSSTIGQCVFLLFAMKGWVILTRKGFCKVTKEGKAAGGRIIRLHRLWEVYLVTFLGEGVEKVHHSAEEMEHILTPELEKQLTLLLENPLHDPHKQPIPPQDEVMAHG